MRGVVSHSGNSFCPRGPLAATPFAPYVDHIFGEEDFQEVFEAWGRRLAFG